MSECWRTTVQDSASLPGAAPSPFPLYGTHLCLQLSNQLPPLLLSLFLQVPKVTKAHLAHLAHLGPKALRVLQVLLEAEDPKALGSQTCSTASAQVTHPCPRETPLQLTIPSSQASPRLWNRRTPGVPVHHQLLEFTQTHVHRPLAGPQLPHPRRHQLGLQGHPAAGQVRPRLV